MEKPFEVGEWVFDRRRWVWCRVLVSLRDHDGRQYGLVVDGWPERSSVLDFTRDPIIPPKPKKTVTKEAERYAAQDFITMKSLTYTVPPRATNVRCLYDIEE